MKDSQCTETEKHLESMAEGSIVRAVLIICLMGYMIIAYLLYQQWGGRSTMPNSSRITMTGRKSKPSISK